MRGYRLFLYSPLTRRKKEFSMKQIRNLFGVAAIALAIVVSMAVMPLTGCSNPTDSGGGKTVVSIAVTVPPTKDILSIGDELDTAGIEVTATYSDGTTAPVAVKDCTFSGYDKNMAGEQTVTVTYKKKTATFTVLVADLNAPVTLISITVIPPTNTQYFTGEPLDTTGMVVTAKYSDGKKEAVTGYAVSGFDTLTAGTQTITVTYQGKTATFRVTLTARSIVATPTASPAGETLVANGTAITLATGTDGADIWYTTDGSDPAKNGKTSTKYANPFAITPPVTVKAVAVKDDWSNSAMLVADYGSAHITVADISIRAPAKNAVPETAVFNQPQERFTEGTVTWLPAHSKFQGETVYTATVTLTAKQGYTFTGLIDSNVKVNGDTAAITNNTGDKVTVSRGFPATGEKIITGITIKSQPTKLTYSHGDKLDLAGLAVTLTYDDDTTKDVAAADFSAQNIATDPGHDIPLEHSTYNGKPVTITYGNLPAQNTSGLTVNAINVSALTVDAIAAQTYTGTPITPAISVKYPVSTGTERELVLNTDYTAAYADNVNAGTATVTITGTKDYTGTRDVTFTINKADPVTIWPTASDITYSQALSDSEFEGGQYVAGVFAWENPDTKPDVGTHTYKVTFTPNDTVNYETVSKDDVSITVNTTPITVADISITGPAKGADPSTEATSSAERFTIGTVTWDPNDSAFRGSTVYTATVTLTAKTGYAFNDLDEDAVKVNGQPATVTSEYTDGSTLTLAYTFTRTGEKIVSGIAIKSPPTKLAYTHGDALSLAGLEVTLSYDDKTTDDAPASDFTARNITAAPANGIPLERKTNDGNPVKITYGNLPELTTGNLTVNAKSVSELTVDAIAAQTYTGSAITPALTVKHSVTTGTERELVLNTDYTAAYTDNVNAGTAATATITGKDDYTGTKDVKFTINAKSISESDVTISGGTATKTYTGAAITQDDVKVMFGTKTLVSGTDYTVEYSGNTNAGQATITISGKGNFTGTTTVHFTIDKANPVITWNTVTATPIAAGQKLSDSTISGGSPSPGGTFTWDAPDTAPSLSGTEYDVTFTPANAANYNTAKGKVSITLTTASISAYYVASIADQEYTGIAIEPALTVKATEGTEDSKALTKNTDYTVAYTNNIGVGTATLTITGIGNYSGSISGKSFKIVPRNVEHLTIEPASIPAQTYTGSALTPDVTVKFGEKPLTKGTDYTVGYTNNTNAGTATVTITAAANSNYTGSTTKNFTIDKANSTVSTWPTAAAITYGQALSDSTDFSGGSYTPAGTFAWDDGATKPDAGSRTYNVTFTPTDTGNYNTAAGTASITVNKAPGAAVVPKISARTASSITVNVVTAPASGQAVEYAIAETDTAPSTESEWNTAATFNRLVTGKIYYIFARTAKSLNYLTGAASDSLQVTVLSDRFVYFWVYDHKDLITSDPTPTIQAGQPLNITKADDKGTYEVVQWTLNGFDTSLRGDTYKFSTTATGKHTIGLIVIDKDGNRYNTNITVTVEE